MLSLAIAHRPFWCHVSCSVLTLFAGFWGRIGADAGHSRAFAWRGNRAQALAGPQNEALGLDDMSALP